MITDLEILFEDEYLIAVNKPSGLLSIPDRYISTKENAFNLVKNHITELYVVHRIDKETSGIILFAKSKEAHKELNSAFESHSILKKYICFTESRPMDMEGLIDRPIAHSIHQTGKMIIHPKGKASQTFYSLIEPYKQFSMLNASPKTGRTHQIRVHLASIGCPIICDPLYGKRSELTIKDLKSRINLSGDQELLPILKRTALHASSLNFNLFNRNYELFAKLPKDLKALQNQLKKWNSISSKL